MTDAGGMDAFGYAIVNANDELYDMAVYENKGEADQDARWCNTFEQRRGPWRVVALVEVRDVEARE